MTTSSELPSEPGSLSLGERVKRSKVNEDTAPALSRQLFANPVEPRDGMFVRGERSRHRLGR